MRAFCPHCGEVRTDTGDDAWGFLMHAGAPQCQRCGLVVELRNDGEAEEDIEEIYDEEEDIAEAELE